MGPKPIIANSSGTVLLCQGVPDATPSLNSGKLFYKSRLYYTLWKAREIKNGLSVLALPLSSANNY